MRLPYATDAGAAVRARLGLIVLQVDETIELEFRQLINLDGVALYCTRVPCGLDLTEATIYTMAGRIPAAARLLPPHAAFDVVGYACTSGATIIGPQRVAGLIRNAWAVGGPGDTGDTGNRDDDHGLAGSDCRDGLAGALVTDPLTAVIAACASLGLRRLGFVTPYVPSVSGAMRQALEAAGLGIAGFGSFEQSQERLVARIRPDAVYDAILQVGRAAPCDGVFVSCTNVRTLGALEQAEQALGVPVISSNQALAWHMLRQAGIHQPLPGLGRLLRAGP